MMFIDGGYRIDVEYSNKNMQEIKPQRPWNVEKDENITTLMCPLK